jgi:calcium/calmodulin-dependent protein kinase (CaM kinase) II/calcium/calmodulin-dependent protein kinase I
VGRGGPPYGVQCDMWSIGVIVFVLLGGYSPFGDGVQVDSRRRDRKGGRSADTYPSPVPVQGTHLQSYSSLLVQIQRKILDWHFKRSKGVSVCGQSQA